MTPLVGVPGEPSGFQNLQSASQSPAKALRRSCSGPAGMWAVAVSGGADSVALLSLLRKRSDLSLRVVHLDHQTRAGASSEDARFVEALAKKWEIPCDIARLDQVVPDISDPPKNR